VEGYRPQPAPAPGTLKPRAIVAVVGNEDGGHHVVAEVLQATDYRDLDATPEKTEVTTKTAARNAVRLTRLFEDAPYPAG